MVMLWYSGTPLIQPPSVHGKFGRFNGVVGLTGFFNEKLSVFSRSGDKKVVVSTGFHCVPSSRRQFGGELHSWNTKLDNRVS